MEKRIFISYSHKDCESVDRIARIIEEKIECSLWFDKKLHGGQQYFSIIADEILNCEYFIFVVSPNSVTSDWCIKELEFAMSEGKKIIAVWLEEFSPPPRVRLVISNTHYLKNYEMNEDDLAKSMAEALNSAYYELFRGEAENKPGMMESESEKYFISYEEKKRINSLLKVEENQDFLTCFEAENAALLGLAYELGTGVEKNIDKADFYYHISSYKGSLDGEYFMLALGLDRGTVEKAAAVRRMNELAEAGCIKALVYWGDEVYLGNWGMEPDKPKAYKWFREAADKGDPVAKYFLGYGYRKGEVVPEDAVIAWMYFHEAAQQNFPRAYRQIGFMYQRGEYVEKNLETARIFFRRAIENGDIFTENFMGDLEYDENNYEAAIACYLKSVDYVRSRNLPRAAPFYNLGWVYEYGQGVEKNLEKAIEYYLEGSLRGRATNCSKRVAGIIDELDDKVKKIEYLKIACERNCLNAEYYLAKAYEEQKDGSYVSCAEACEIFEKGANKGCLYCLEALMGYYCWSFCGDDERFVSRDKALSCFSLYFSLLDRSENKNHLKKIKESKALYKYYYIYGVELDTNKENGDPDKKMAMYYFKKCLEFDAGTYYFNKILSVVVDYIRGNEEEGYKKDIPHGEELLDACYDYFKRIAGNLKEEEKSKKIEHLKACYNVLEAEYSTGEKFRDIAKEKKRKCQSKAVALSIM